MFGNPIVPLWPSVQFQFQHHKVEWGLQPNYKKGMSRAVVKTSPACFGVFTLLWVWQSFKMWKLSASAHGVREPPHISFQLKKKINLTIFLAASSVAFMCSNSHSLSPVLFVSSVLRIDQDINQAALSNSSTRAASLSQRCLSDAGTHSVDKSSPRTGIWWLQFQ